MQSNAGCTDTTIFTNTNTEELSGTYTLYVIVSIVIFVPCLVEAAHAPVNIESFSVHDGTFLVTTQ